MVIKSISDYLLSVNGTYPTTADVNVPYCTSLDNKKAAIPCGMRLLGTLLNLFESLIGGGGGN
ncbi:hypothetical protein METHB2_230018 [Candidatus Methylobacter favarea]|uniref:Uncharacterized protein n=1 Tax=Candidatus Methylobacter favarea TaxID=2707345 RepID=A0A8S0XI98_9GAMM|nr:hypothetical protein METHB2_230018 [Candidatus Methylobacter favarea]